MVKLIMAGKQLSDANFTQAEKDKISSLESTKVYRGRIPGDYVSGASVCRDWRCSPSRPSSCSR